MHASGKKLTLSFALWAVPLAFLGPLVCPARVAAQTEMETALSEALYRQARDLMAAEKFAEACPKFAESYRLDPATGTLLNLAMCREREGKLATAWLLWADAARAARRDRREDRETFAREHMSALEPQLSRLTLVVPVEADEPELELTLDGVRVAVAARGVPTLVDPGQHWVEARAPGKRTWRHTVEVGAVADRPVLAVPKLEPEALSVALAPEKIDNSPANTAVPSAPPQTEEAASRPMPSLVYVTGGVTVALGAAAVVTGFIYLNERKDYDNEPDASTEKESKRDTARTYGIANVGLWTATAVGAALTTYLYVTRPERAAALGRVRVSPWLSHELAGVGLHGSF